MPPNGNAKRTNLGSGTVSGNGSAAESDSSGWNGEGPDASCNEGSKFVPASSGPGTSPRQQWPPSTSPAKSAPTELDVTSMSFEEQDDSARIADLEAQPQAIRDANEKLQRRVADQYLLLNKESKDAEALMAEAQCKLADLEGQLRTANEEVAVLQNKLEASEKHSLAGFRRSVGYAAFIKARSPRLQNISASQASYRFIKKRPAAVALAKENPASNGVSIVVGHVMTATSASLLKASAQVHLVKSSIQLMMQGLQSDQVHECHRDLRVFRSSNRRGQHSSLSRDAAVEVRSLRLALIERRYGAINGKGLPNAIRCTMSAHVKSTTRGSGRAVSWRRGCSEQCGQVHHQGQGCGSQV